MNRHGTIRNPPSSKMSRNLVSLVTIGATVALASSAILYSRILALFVTNVPILPVLILALSALLPLFVPRVSRSVSLYIFIGAIVFLGLVWTVVFWLSGGYDFRLLNAATFHGLYLCLAFYALTITVGIKKSADTLFIVSSLIVIVYSVMSFIVANGWQGYRFESSAVLYDLERGVRLYLPSAIWALSFFYALNLLRNVSGRPIRAAVLTSLTVINLYAFYMAQSRFAAVAVVFVLLLKMVPRVARRAAIVVIGFVIMTILLIWLNGPHYIAEVLFLLTGFAIRAEAFILGQRLFVENWLLGIGLPSGPRDFLELYKFPFDPTDIGPAGIAVSFGLVGLALFFYVLFTMARFCWVMERRSGPRVRAIEEAALFTIIYSLVSPTALLFDGSLIVAFIMGIKARAEHRKKLPQRASIRADQLKTRFKARHKIKPSGSAH